MSTFQRITLKIAGILLLIIIIILAFTFYSMSNSQLWPPIISKCPDYFEDVNGDGSNCVNTYGIGDPVIDSENFSVAPYIGTNGDCEKYNWCITNNLTWDGISYGVQNPCNASNK